MTNAAQGMEAGVFEAVDRASAQIERLGGDATKFRENIMALIKLKNSLFLLATS